MLRAQAARADVTLNRDVVYQTVDGVDLKLDVAMPAGPGPFPLILCVHGGAWRMGDKSKFTPLIDNFARHDYVAASINYRFAPKYKFPAQLDDTKAALQFLKRHAREYKIDVNKVGATGESAGSHLAMLMGFEASEQAGSNPSPLRLGAIVNYYGPSDLARWDVAPLVSFMWQRQFHERIEDSMLRFLGAQSRDAAPVKAASPINHVTGRAPPVLTLHGSLDPVVPFRQAEWLHAALKEHGVAERLIPIENGLHGGWAPDAKRQADAQAIAWFDKYLKGKPDPLPEITSIRMDGKGDGGLDLR
jgi:acetyl esterase/lipase